MRGRRRRRRRRQSSDNAKRPQPYYAMICGVLTAVGSLWGAVLWWAHASLTSSSSFSHPMIRSSSNNQQAFVGTIHYDDPNLYFGWQPHIPDTMECSWRTCFHKDHNCNTCRDSVQDMGVTPVVDDTWIPDVTLLHRMRLAGRDAQGRPWPPTLDPELCEKMGPNGGTQDSNKDCK